LKIGNWVLTERKSSAILSKAKQNWLGNWKSEARKWRE